MRSIKCVLLAAILSSGIGPVSGAQQLYTFTGLPCRLTTLPCADPAHPQNIQFFLSALMSGGSAGANQTGVRSPYFSPTYPDELAQYLSCSNCDPRYGAVLQEHVLGGINGTGVPADVVAFFDDTNNGGISEWFYYFADGAFSQPGTHTTDEWEALLPPGHGPFVNEGTLNVATTPEPSSTALELSGLCAILVVGGMRRRLVGRQKIMNGYHALPAAGHFKV